MARERAERWADLNRDISIRRDQAGVPHIQAGNWLDGLYGLGYMHARDRLTQILFSRTVASGQTAELIADKPELVETDRFFRRFGLHRQLDLSASRFNAAELRQILSYCQGINDGILASGRSIPMWATGFRPRPWDVEAVLIVGKLLSFGGLAVSQMQNERLLIELIHAGANRTALQHIFWPKMDHVDFELMRQVQMSNQLSDSALDLLTDLPRLAGSNAWAVSPRRSATGGALLAGDPHLEVNRLPAIWYEAVLEWEGNYAAGATLPGCPLFAVARTRNLAWGVTYMKGDTTDFFIEHCRPGGRTGWQYRRGDVWNDFRRRVETIGRKGAAPLVMEVYENDQGILDADLEEAKEGYFLSVAWSGDHGTSEQAITAWLDLIAAKSVAEGMQVARQCPHPTLCFVMADSEGHIGLQSCGRFPKRSDTQAGLLPLPAWDEKNHWQGWLPFDQLPHEFDPPSGFIATANEATNPLNGPLLVTQFLPDYRKRRIDERLAELPQATVEDMQRLQHDLLSVQARDLLSVFLEHLPEGTVKQKLTGWDCRYSPDSREATLFQRLYVNVIIEVCGQEHILGWRRALYICTRAGYSTMVLAAIDRLIMSDDSPVWRTIDKGELIRKAANRLAGFEPVPWSQFNNFQFTNRFVESRRVGRLLGFNSKRIPMPGCHATPFQGYVFQTATREQTYAPSYHFVTDMSCNHAWTNLPGGPSESRFSRFYQSDVERWIAGEYKKLGPECDGDEIAVRESGS
jgi:penicillin amidase